MKVKVCCISSLAEARLALEYGADALGLVGYMPSGPGVIADALVREIVSKLPADCDTFLLTCETEAQKLVNHHIRTKTKTMQLVDEVEEGAYARLKAEFPKLRLVQVVHVEDEAAITYAQRVAPHVDALLLDSGSKKGKVAELGGTGRTHNWEISRRIVESVTIPVYLAGGLNATNVREAVEKVRPYGVDLCSGIRTHGRLDETKLSAFVEALGVL